MMARHLPGSACLSPAAAFTGGLGSIAGSGEQSGGAVTMLAGAGTKWQAADQIACQGTAGGTA